MPAKAGKRLPGPEPHTPRSQAEDPRGLQLTVPVVPVVPVVLAVAVVAAAAVAAPAVGVVVAAGV